MPIIFQWGRVKDLCQAEATQLFQPHVFSHLDEHHSLVEMASDEAMAGLDRSAGIVKALEVVYTLPKSADRDQIAGKIVELLSQVKNLTFSVFSPGLNSDDAISAGEIKLILKSQSISSRFRNSSRERGLSAAVLTHQQSIEIGVFASDDQILLAKTFWVQPIDHWSFKDAGKPHRDRKRGMLPAKLARQMINLVTDQPQSGQSLKLYDPFCGSGTVLIEGLELGWQVIGSDISREAVQNSAENLHFFTQHPDFTVKNPAEPRLFVSDATQVDLKNVGDKVDAIVTEPFLGKQTPHPKDLPNQFKGLEKMYWGAFKRWTKILKNGAELVIVTPLVEANNRTFDLKSIIDKSTTLGYTIVSGPHLYRRPQTIVQRAIYHLSFKANK